MNALLVFYSRDGCTRAAAREISKELGCRAEEIKDMKNRKGLLGFLSAGMDASLKRLTEIKGAHRNPARYRMIIIGTPIWNGHMSPAIRTYVSKNEHKFRKIALFCAEFGSGGEKALLEIEQICGKKPVAILVAKKSAMESEEFKKDLFKFCNSVRNAV